MESQGHGYAPCLIPRMHICSQYEKTDLNFCVSPSQCAAGENVIANFHGAGKSGSRTANQQLIQLDHYCASWCV
jgi:hypothetical protein